MASFYLEHTTGRKAFWRGIQRGRVFLGHWGSIGTQGQTRLWRYPSPGEAREALVAKKVSKEARGYREVDDPMSPEEHDRLFRTALADEPVEIFWKIPKPGVDTHLLEQAAHESAKWLQELGCPELTRIRFEAEGRGYVRLCEGAAEVHFGFPTPSVVQEQIAQGMAMDPDNHPSFRGWLSAQGTGQGVIERVSPWIELPARLFLARLKWLAEEQGIVVEAEDSLENPIDCDLAVQGLDAATPWLAYREELLALATEHGWVRGRPRVAGSNLTMQLGDERIEVITGW